MINGYRNMHHLTNLQNLVCSLGNLPTSYVLAMSYEEQLWWLCDFFEKKLLPAIENNTQIAEETQASFIELKNYVDDYFNNLDVQDEINNKLDQMVESGELAEIIDEYFNTKLEFHAIAKSSATYVVKFKNGKTMFIDTGKAEQWDDIRTAIQKLGITHFDYGIITHFHSDHFGNIQNFINEYNLDNTTKIWVQMKPDFYNHGDDIKDSEANYDNNIQLFMNAGIIPEVPANDSYFEIDNLTKLHFLNTSQEWAEDYYVDITEYDDEGINYNHFSLVTEILHKNISILATGDIERAVEEKIADYIHQCEVMTAPHHLVNQDASLNFYRSAKAKWAIGMYITNNTTWLKEWYKSAMYLKENGAKLVTPTWSVPDSNYCFSFYSNGEVVTTTVRGYGDNPQNMESLLYDRVEQAIDYSKQTENDITLRHLMENMRRGSIMNIYIYTEFMTQKAQLYSDLKDLFPMLAGGWVVTIQKGISAGNSLGYSQISATNGYLNYIAKQNVNDNFEFKVTGFGTLREITGEANLIEALEQLPIGNYNCTFTDTESNLLAHNGSYDLMIYKSTNIENVRISLLAILRDGTSSQHSEGILAGHYNYADTTPQIRWYRLGNSNYMGSANGMTSLINNLKKFKRGHYIMRYYQDDSGFLDSSAGYDLSINVSQSISENESCTATVMATLRSTIPDNPSSVQVALCYVNVTEDTPTYTWHKLNN
ncbi:MAG: MBL fold metallo-hydrolase [Elusimicrobia bacterium]|nr:MBL fold metallo-hydrolase [Elusimicrobiota bacterium]